MMKTPIPISAKKRRIIVAIPQNPKTPKPQNPKGLVKVF